jgi:SAM-dependent methyltransferase
MAERVVGIDIDTNVIRHVSNKYIRHNLQFKAGSITDIPISGDRIFQVRVCFEGIEHIDDHEELLKEVKRVLAPDGALIVSTPNKSAYSDEPQYKNPFHVSELYYDEFRELLERCFNRVAILGQRVNCNSNIWPGFSASDPHLAEYVIERNLREFTFVDKNKRVPRYFIAIASDAGLQIEWRASMVTDISDSLLSERDRQIAAHASALAPLGQEVARISDVTLAREEALKVREEQSYGAHKNAKDVRPGH